MSRGQAAICEEWIFVTHHLERVQSKALDFVFVCLVIGFVCFVLFVLFVCFYYVSFLFSIFWWLVSTAVLGNRRKARSVSE